MVSFYYIKAKQSELPSTAETCCVIDQLEAQIQTLRNLAIADSTFAVEQCMYQFLNFWSAGLQPSLSLDTKQDGAISINLNHTTTAPYHEDHYGNLTTRSSDHGSRRRRRLRRSAESTREAVVPNSSLSTQNCQDVSSEDVNILVLSPSETMTSSSYVTFIDANKSES